VRGRLAKRVHLARIDTRARARNGANIAHLHQALEGVHAVAVVARWILRLQKHAEVDALLSGRAVHVGAKLAKQIGGPGAALAYLAVNDDW
jgi:hypothetical protein